MSESEENIQDQLHLKQELLKEEIVAKNYDGQKFLEYCMNLKENGDDMNNWKLDELKSVVENFKADYEYKEKEKEKEKIQENKEEKKENNEENLEEEKPNEKETKNEENINKEKDIESKEETINSMNKEKDKDKEIDTFEPKIKEVTCKLLEKSILNNKEIKVTIKDPKTNEKSLLSLGYVSYEVFTEPSNWSVRRRYSDFTLLRNILCKFYPRYFIPPLPEKRIGTKRFQPDFIEKRMKILQMFIDKLTCNEEFKANEALIMFLNFIDHATFEKKMKELYNKPFSQTFEDIKTSNGKLNILQQDNSSDSFLTKVNTYYKSQKQIISKLSYALKNYYRNVQTVCQNLEEISKNFEELEKLTIDINIEKEISKAYEMLKIFFKERKKISENENEIIHDKIKGFIKIQKLKTNSFIEIIDSRDILKQKFNTENTKLIAKKEKLYSSVKDINKWEMSNIENLDKPLLFRDKNYAFKYMCSKDSQYIESLKSLLEFSNYNNYTAFKTINKENVDAFVNNMKEFSKSIYPFMNDELEVGNKLKSLYE